MGRGKSIWSPAPLHIGHWYTNCLYTQHFYQNFIIIQNRRPLCSTVFTNKGRVEYTKCEKRFCSQICIINLSGCAKTGGICKKELELPTPFKQLILSKYLISV